MVSTELREAVYAQHEHLRRLLYDADVAALRTHRDGPAWEERLRTAARALIDALAVHLDYEESFFRLSRHARDEHEAQRAAIARMGELIRDGDASRLLESVRALAADLARDMRSEEQALFGGPRP